MSRRRIAAIEALVCRDVGRKHRRHLIDASRRRARRRRAVAGRRDQRRPDHRLLRAARRRRRARDRRPGRHRAAGGRAGGLRRAGAHCGRHALRRRRAGGGRTRPAAAWPSTRSASTIGRRSSVSRAWRGAGVSHAVAIERCGRSADGRPRNMRGVDVSPWTAPLDDLFLAGPWIRLAVGDGGNEIGMGKLPRRPDRRAPCRTASEIACVTVCDHLVVAGVSNWGAYGLMAALAVLRADWSATIAKFLTAERDLAVTRAIVDKAGAVDGVTAQSEATVDGFRAGDPWRADRRACVALRGGRRRTRFARHGKSLRADTSRNPRRGPPALPEVRRRLLARARPRARLSDGVRARR